MGERWAAALVLAAVLCLVTAGAAGAQTAVTGPQLRALAERAASDPRALAQLRAVQQVDGRPADLGRALAGAEGPELAARLQALAGGDAPGTAAAVDAAAVRDEAEQVLDGRRFTPSRVPRPFAGVLRTLGSWLEPLAEPVGGLWARIMANVVAKVGLVVVVFLLALVLCLRLIGRRAPGAVGRSRRIGGEGEGLDPDELERRAAEAERAGDLDRAVRLRFVAGVLRLDRAGVVTYRSSLTTGQLRARVPAATFAELAVAFDEIAYGGRHAGEADVRAATEGWPRVLAEARR